MKTFLKNQVTTLLFIAVLFFACKGEQHEKEIGEINSIRNKLAQTDSLLKYIDLENAEKLETEVKNNSQFVQFNINKIGDTIDFKTALFLSNYKSLQEALEGLSENGDKLESAIDSTQNTLSNLEHDITNNSLSKGLTADGCIKQEEDRVNEMYEYVNAMRSTYSKSKVYYDSLNPLINDYMKVLNQKLLEKNSSPKK